MKGISFHPKRPWVLASLHSGVIQLWDYRMGALIDKFEEHDGPVRSVAFHPTQPLFASGGDDTVIRVWNYKQRCCLFSLRGHFDFIRTVEFHKEQPWILSASDDNSIRIWDWQSRKQLKNGMLLGHTNYVMCATFHPEKPLIVSASLDATVRLWDISTLYEGSTSRGGRESNGFGDGMEMSYQTQVLEGHEKDVNWVAFHPSMPFIASASDDRSIRIWRISGEAQASKAWYIDTLRSHLKNVTCAVFHPKQDLLISASEDMSLRVWDVSKRTPIHSFRREHDRFWIVAAHPENALLAAGHDSGMMVFKLERERPAYVAASNSNSLFYVKDKYVRIYEFGSKHDVPSLVIKKGTYGAPKSLFYNAAENIILVHYKPASTAGNTAPSSVEAPYEIYKLPDPRDAQSGGDKGAVESRRGAAISAVFVARNRMACLERHATIVIRNLKNEVVRKFEAPHLNTECLFPAPPGFFLLKADDKICSYDMRRDKISTVTAAGVKYVSYSKDYAYCALMSKHTITLVNVKTWTVICSLHESVRVKSGVWDRTVFVYTTLNHIKYYLVSGDKGLVRTLDIPVYITAVSGNTVYCLDREVRNRVLSMDPTEYRFKEALLEGRYDDVMSLIRKNPLCGSAIISWLVDKGQVELALFFVQDVETKFELALLCGNVTTAVECAQQMNQPAAWSSLAKTAYQLGKWELVDTCLQRVQDWPALAWFYMLSGNQERLKSVQSVTMNSRDALAAFHVSCYLGDASTRLRVLENSGQLALAHLMAHTHGLTSDLARLEEKMSARSMRAEGIEDAWVSGAKTQPLDVAQPKIVCGTSWPQLRVSAGPFAALFRTMPKDASLLGEGVEEADLGGGVDVGGDWGGDLDLGDDTTGLGVGGGEGFGEEYEEELTEEEKRERALMLETQGLSVGGGDEDGGWKIDDDLDLPDMELPSGMGGTAGGAGGATAYFVAPTEGAPLTKTWTTSTHPVDHFAAGDFLGGMQVLDRTVAAMNFAPLKEAVMSIFMAHGSALITLPGVPSQLLPLPRSSSSSSSSSGGGAAGPQLFVHNTLLKDIYLKNGYAHMTAGRFADARREFLAILSHALLVVPGNKQESTELASLVSVAREYIIAINLELSRKELATSAGNEGRNAELACYFTHCQLQSIHAQLSLRSAMSICYKLKAFDTAAVMGRRLLELNPKPEIASQARKVIHMSEQAMGGSNFAMDYDSRNPFVLCASTFKPIYQGSPSVICPYCEAHYAPALTGTLCSVCQISRIGAQVPGLPKVR